MTTGERLVGISTLSTGTALEHFLNIEVVTVVTNQVLGGSSPFYSVKYINESPESIIYIPNNVSVVTYIDDDVSSVSYKKDEESEISVASSSFVNTAYKN